MLRRTFLGLIAGAVLAGTRYQRFVFPVKRRCQRYYWRVEGNGPWREIKYKDIKKGDIIKEANWEEDLCKFSYLIALQDVYVGDLGLEVLQYNTITQSQAEDYYPRVELYNKMYYDGLINLKEFNERV